MAHNGVFGPDTSTVYSLYIVNFVDVTWPNNFDKINCLKQLYIGDIRNWRIICVVVWTLQFSTWPTNFSGSLEVFSAVKEYKMGFIVSLD